MADGTIKAAVERARAGSDVCAGTDTRAGAVVRRELIRFSLDGAFDFLSSEYAELFDNAEATSFQHPLWMDGVFGRLAPQYSTKFLVGRKKADSGLVCVIPLLRRRFGFLRAYDVADLNVGDYNAFVIDQRAIKNPNLVKQILEALRNLKLVRMRNVRNAAIGFPMRDQLIRTNLMPFQAHEVELGSPADGWQSRILKPEFLRFLQKKRKRLTAKGTVSFQEVDDPDRIRVALECLRRFRQDRWTNDLLDDPKHFEFYVDIAVRGCKSSFARTYTLSVNGAIVSALFGVWHRGRFSFLLIGFDGRLRNYSVGMLILESAIEDCIRRGDHVFDLTIGDEEYKRKFATRSVPMLALWFGKRPWISIAATAVWGSWKARSAMRTLRKPEGRAKASVSAQ